MKLLYLLNIINGRGGVERIAFDKINYLVNLGYDIHVLYFGDNGQKPFFYVDSKVHFHCIHSNPLASFIIKFFSIIKIFFSYISIVRKINPDLIVNMNVNILSWIVPFVFHKIPKVIELHQSYDGVQLFNSTEYGSNSFKSFFSMWLRNHIYPKYDRLIVLTESDKIKWGFPNIEVIQNYTKLSPCITPDYKSNRFIWVGRLSHQKGVDILIDVWKRFVDNHPDARLTIIGNSSDQYKNDLLDFLSDTQYSDTVLYVEESNNIIDYYSGSSIYISTSRYEGLPLCLIEASTCGLPIVCFDIVGNDEVVVDKDNGYLIPPYNIVDFVTAMDQLYSDNEIVNIFGRKSIEMSKKFQIDSIMAKWNLLFKSLIS